MAFHSHIESVLWNQDQISARVADLAARISTDFAGTSSPPVLVGVATGAFIFLADLARRINLPIAVDFVRVESYGSGTQSNGDPRISSDLKVDVKNKHVILVYTFNLTRSVYVFVVESLCWDFRFLFRAPCSEFDVASYFGV